jgi:hypothetical protein
MRSFHSLTRVDTLSEFVQRLSSRGTTHHRAQAPKVYHAAVLATGPHGAGAIPESACA